MTRKSAAALSVVAAEIDHRPAPPVELTDEQSAIWVQIVNRMPAEWFKRETHDLLAQYCRHVVSGRRVASLIQTAERREQFDLQEYDKLLAMQEREGRALSSLATKMRLTQQSTYNDKNGHTAKNSRKTSNPWQDDIEG